MSNRVIFSLAQDPENRNRNQYASYSGPPSPLAEALTHRDYSRWRSRLVDQWLVYAEAEGFVAAAQSGEVAL